MKLVTLIIVAAIVAAVFLLPSILLALIRRRSSDKRHRFEAETDYHVVTSGMGTGRGSDATMILVPKEKHRR